MFAGCGYSLLANVSPPSVILVQDYPSTPMYLFVTWQNGPIDLFSPVDPTYLGAGFGVITILSVLSVVTGKMDVPGGVTGALIAASLFIGGGFPMLAILGAFFVLGVLATRWKREKKESLGLAQENHGKRSVRHAISNGGIAAIYALMAAFTTSYMVLLAMAAGSFAAATGDTLSSELGNVYGKRYINILSFRPDKRGKDGVISGEGTLLGALGSLCIAGIFGLSFQAWEWVPYIALAGILGNIVDSLLGATLQQSGVLSNDKVNFFSTWIAACAVLVFKGLF